MCGYYQDGQMTDQRAMGLVDNSDEVAWIGMGLGQGTAAANSPPTLIDEATKFLEHLAESMQKKNKISFLGFFR